MNNQGMNINTLKAQAKQFYQHFLYAQDVVALLKGKYHRTDEKAKDYAARFAAKVFEKLNIEEFKKDPVIWAEKNIELISCSKERFNHLDFRRKLPFECFVKRYVYESYSTNKERYYSNLKEKVTKLTGSKIEKEQAMGEYLLKIIGQSNFKKDPEQATIQLLKIMVNPSCLEGAWIDFPKGYCAAINWIRQEIFGTWDRLRDLLPDKI